MKYILLNNHYKDIQSFVHVIPKLYPNFLIDKPSLHKKLYPTKPFQDYRIRNLFYRLDQSLQDFYKIHAKETKEINHLLLLRKLKVVDEKNSYKKGIQLLDTTSALNNYFLAYEKLEQTQATPDRAIERNFQEVNESLDMHYINEKLKLACATLNDSRINNKKYNLGVLDLIEDNLALLITNKKSLTYLLYQAYLFQKYDDEQAFSLVLHTLNKVKYLATEELKLLFTMCNNFCIRFINKQMTNYFNDLFVLYKLQIAYKSIYDQNGQIQATSINNILTVALRVKEYTWAEKLINSNKSKLPNSLREETYNYLLARLSYSRKEFQKTLKLLLQTEPKDFLNNLSFRVLQIKSWYELDEYDQMENTIENFRLYLLRHKSKSYHYSYHVNFIRHLKQIVKASGNKKLKLEVLKQLQSESQVAEKTWLLSLLQ